MFSTNPETQERCHFFFSFSLPFLKLYRARHQRRQKREEHPNKASILHMTISTCVFHFVHCHEPFSFRNRSNQQLGNGQLLIKMYTSIFLRRIFVCDYTHRELQQKLFCHLDTLLSCGNWQPGSGMMLHGSFSPLETEVCFVLCHYLAEQMIGKAPGFHFLGVCRLWTTGGARYIP